MVSNHLPLTLSLSFIGDAMYKQMETEVAMVEKIHNTLPQVVSHKTDSAQMAKFKETFMQ